MNYLLTQKYNYLYKVFVQFAHIRRNVTSMRLKKCCNELGVIHYGKEEERRHRELEGIVKQEVKKKMVLCCP